MVSRSVQEFAAAVRDSVVVWASPAPWSTPPEGADGLVAPSGIVDYWPADQVVVVGAGTSIAELQAALAEHRQRLPLVDGDGWLSGRAGVLGPTLGLNLPHALESQCGSWRDWVLGMTLVLADGTVVKAGAKVVKNVAGYDLHRLQIGARGTLAAVAEVVLRTTPVAAVPPSEAVVLGGDPTEVGCIVRVLPADRDRLRERIEGRAWAFDPASATAWLQGDGTEVERFEGEWRFAIGVPPDLDETSLRYMRRAKALFDPGGKLNPGAMGCF